MHLKLRVLVVCSLQHAVEDNRRALLSTLIVRGFVSVEAACEALVINPPQPDGLQYWAPVLLGVPHKQSLQGSWSLMAARHVFVVLI